jgi:exosortase
MVSPTKNLSQAGNPAPVGDWQGWVQFFLLLVSIWFLYNRIAVGLVRQWWLDPDYNYCFFVPLLAAAIVWRESAKLKTIAPQPSWAGLVIIAVAMALLTLGVLGAENFLSRSSFLFLLAGLLIQFRGWKFFRRLLFPWAALFLMIPLPSIVFNEISLPLQFLASRVGASLLSVSGIPVVREGNVILLPTMALDVAAACSGLRSVFSLITLAVFYGYFFERNTGRRVLLIACSVPIAILANGLRITFTGMIGHYFGMEKAEGFYHLSSGILIFLFSFVALVMLRRFFEWWSGVNQRRVAA